MAMCHPHPSQIFRVSAAVEQSGCGQPWGSGERADRPSSSQKVTPAGRAIFHGSWHLRRSTSPRRRHISGRSIDADQGDALAAECFRYLLQHSYTRCRGSRLEIRQYPYRLRHRTAVNGSSEGVSQSPALPCHGSAAPISRRTGRDRPGIQWSHPINECFSARATSILAGRCDEFSARLLMAF